MSNRQSKAARSLNPLRWFFNHWGKLFLVSALVLAGYCLYLDAKILKHFGGTKWEVPAQIFARPMVLRQGQEILVDEVIEELEWLGYRRVPKASGSGQYSINGGKLTFYRRAFELVDGPKPLLPVQLTFEDGKLAKIYSIDEKNYIFALYLEPWLVTRFTHANEEDRMLVELKEVPEALTRMLLLIEDKDFYQHHGIAPLSIARALLANISAGRTVQGGSTLTQQLVKNFFLTREKSLTRKINEALMSLLIELRYSKDEILEAYLNEVFLGQKGANPIHGFGLASFYYFDRPLKELTVPEMAMLVGMIKGPSYYNPRRNPERVIERRNLVLKQLFDEQLVEPATYTRWIKSPLALSDQAGLARGAHPAFMEQVKRELRELLPDTAMQQAGIRIYTTLDPVAQRKAEQSMINSLDELETQRKINGLEGAVVVTDIATGEIRAMVGSRQTEFHGFNRALDARRAIGSVIKPAIYLAALERSGQYHLATPLQDAPISLKSSNGKVWSPKNYDKEYRGQVSLMDALVNSLNIPTVTLGMDLGLTHVTQMLNRLGVEQEIEPYPALTLGAVSLTPFEVSQMYQTLANEGRYESLHSIVAISTSSGKLLRRYRPESSFRVDAKAVYLLNYALHKVTREGTAKTLKKAFPDLYLAGKTGTTDDYRDSWYVGFDRHNLVTVWMGKDNNESTGLTGASGAMSLYRDFLSRQHPKSLVRPFPEGLGIAHFDSFSGLHKAAGCPHVVSVPAILESLPPAQLCEEPPKQEEEQSFWQRLFGFN
ncbi:penicillin-binding protein 1B [Aliiglaciecola sp. CAU 1673]|uniref:penicillin-binding protein 1B n=1 Tax=Aliiglaciecola sp. CAU 1673 TaxID=3032595 RepID=UPI0023DCCDCF|nr:penicillin-binding protein 1B [Aliiglaciecola sp. CAU 1673]MDF2178537.1 penicillin-binding protein 1B [Aliiglaciecola sp. CAU 1673]